MLTVLPVHTGDVFVLFNQLRWIKQLGGCPGHTALIVADAGLQWDHCQTAVALAQDCFDSVHVITNGNPVPGWIAGSNSLWSTAAQYCKDRNHEFFWLEPDAVPLRKGWLDDIARDYEPLRGNFLASLYSYTGTDPSVPRQMMTGIAVYPPNAIEYYRPVEEAFDVQLSRNALYLVHETKLIQQTWGQPGLPPTFRNTKTFAPRHAFTLDKLDPAAVIFHRNKDGTLIDLLRAKAGVAIAKRFLVVLPVCSKDSELMVKCLEWMRELDGQNQFDCLLSHDPTLGPVPMGRLREAAARAFRTVKTFEYPRPPRERWPDACNMAFQSTAQHVQAYHDRPWLWLEADCVPLKPDWLPTLWQEYQNCSLPVMGPVIDGAGHMNGTAIYPANFATIAPRAMRATVTAWDTEMTPDIVGKTHNCCRIFQHAWGHGPDGKLHPSNGIAPHFPSPIAVQQWIEKDAVLFHRCKDGSLITQLRIVKK